MCGVLVNLHFHHFPIHVSTHQHHRVPQSNTNSLVINPFFILFQVMALPIPIVVDNFADYYSEQVRNAERICKSLPIADDQIFITNKFQKKLEAKEMKREAQTIEDKWEMRKAILAKEALIESVCSTTKVSRRQTIEGKAICNHQVSHSS